MSAMAMSLSPVDTRYFHITFPLLVISDITICTRHPFQVMVVIKQAAESHLLTLCDRHVPACGCLRYMAGQHQLGVTQLLERMATLPVLTLVTQASLWLSSVPIYTSLSICLRRKICELPGYI